MMAAIVEEKMPIVGGVSPRGLAFKDDNSSSSGLSDPDDRTGNEDGNDAHEADGEGFDAYDTEAETERLEETPRKQRNVVLTPPIANFPDYRGLRVDATHRDRTPIEAPHESSNTSAEGTGEEEREPPTSLTSRKRKRSIHVPDRKEARNTARKTIAKVSKPSRSRSPIVISRSPTPMAEDQSQTEMQTVQPAVKLSHKKGKRKGRKIKEDEVPSRGENSQLFESPEEVADQREVASSNEEDIEVDDTVERDGVDGDNASKSEEDLVRKKTAMHALSAIENCFATFRDKLFDERLAQCNEELAMLEQPSFIHPELLLMKEVIDRRRNQKIQYEQNLLKFRLESLQRESIANKAQLHSQYMLGVGELRDTYLSQINAEIYQTQRERRACDSDMPDFIYTYNAKRSTQIMDQTAYNEEISLLSGMAKYAGFPAAPDIIKVRLNEWEEDRRTYQQRVAVEDEANNARRPSQHNPPMLRASLSAASTFSRAQPAAEDKFLQQNAWANPQHPAHQRHRQVSSFSQVTTPSATPMNPRRVTETHGSASTIPDHPSARNSSMLPTPATEELRDPHSNIKPTISQAIADETPSRVVEEIPAISGKTAEQSYVAPPSEEQPSPSFLSSQATGSESSNPGALAKPPSFTQNGRARHDSPMIRNPVIKAEDPGSIYHHSPIGQQKQTSHIVNTVSNTYGNRVPI